MSGFVSLRLSVRWSQKGDKIITMKSEDIFLAIEKDLALLKTKFWEANLID